MKPIHVGLFIGLFSILLSCSPALEPETASTIDETPQKELAFGQKKESYTSGEIHIAVDESLKPIIQAEIETFELLYDRAKIHPHYLSGEEAIQAMLLHDSIRMAITTRRLTKEEEKVLGIRNIKPEQSRILRDGVVMTVHKENPNDTLTLDQVRGILTGSITSWKQIDPQSPNDRIDIVFDHAKSGTIAFLRDSLLQGTSMTTKNVFAKTETPAVFNYVAEHPGALGITGNAWISDVDDPVGRELQKGLRIVKLERREDSGICAYDRQFFGPYQSFLDQECYPLTRDVFTLVRETIYGLGTGFVSFIDGPRGQRIIHKSGLATVHRIPRVISLPPKEKATQEAK